MKLQITERDIHRMVNECVSKILRESDDAAYDADKFPGASRRNVREIIIGNILAKHPLFRGNGSMAWSYYTYRHQEKREGDTSSVPQELIEKMRGILRNEEEIKNKIFRAYHEFLSLWSKQHWLGGSVYGTKEDAGSMEFIDGVTQSYHPHKMQFNLTGIDFSNEQEVLDSMDKVKEAYESSEDMEGDKYYFETLMKVLKGALLNAQFEQGKKTYKTMLFQAGVKGEIKSPKFDERLSAYESDENAIAIDLPGEIKMVGSKFIPKYNICID